MKVIVDTNVWSLALRRRNVTAREAAILRELISEGRAQLLGPVRQELLSGLRDDAEFERLRTLLDGFPDIEIHSRDYVEAAKFSNICARRGIQATSIDFLICACGVERSMPIFTMDNDFHHLSRYLPIQLYSVDVK